jgi:hypothetical protein
MTDVESDSWVDQPTDDEHETEVLPPVPVAAPGADFSLLDTFKAELQELVEAESVMIPVQGYEKTGLQIKYHMPASGKELDAIGRRVQKQYKERYDQNIYIALDTMIYLCDGLFVQPEGVEEPVMLDPQEIGEPVKFDERLAGIMGMNGNEPIRERRVVRRLFGGNDLAVLTHAERLNRWLQNTKADLNAEIWQLGE